MTHTQNRSTDVEHLTKCVMPDNELTWW